MKKKIHQKQLFWKAEKIKTIFRFRNFCRCLYPWKKVTFMRLFLKYHCCLLSLLFYPPAMDSYKLLIVWVFRNMLLYALFFLLWCWEHNWKSSPISWIAVISSICSFTLPHYKTKWIHLNHVENIIYWTVKIFWGSFTVFCCDKKQNLHALFLALEEHFFEQYF